MKSRVMEQGVMTDPLPENCGVSIPPRARAKEELIGRELGLLIPNLALKTPGVILCDELPSGLSVLMEVRSTGAGKGSATVVVDLPVSTVI